MIKTWKLLSGWAVAASFCLLAACGGGGSSSAPPASTLTNDSIVATPSLTGALNVAVGSSTALSVTFTTSDGETATNLSITTGLGALPAGWTGPTTFTCASVSTGSGCMVNLTYHPTAAGNGGVTLAYSYTNNAGTSKTGTATVTYAATSNDNVVATQSPAGQIAAITGSTNTIGVTFTTDDGQKATDLRVTTGLTTLPAGWTGPAAFTCGSVSTGSGCMLNLNYRPTTVGSGSLTIGYSYSNNAGTSKTGTATISFAATSQDNVIATQSPSGQVVVVTGGTTPVGVTFTTDDGQKATKLSITAGLSTLPAGWTGPSSFTCASVSTGSGCMLNLAFHPTAGGSGTVSLSYSYTNNAGTSKTGTAMVSYVATTQDTVGVTQSPSNPINAVVSGGTVSVMLTFTTNDGQTATNLAVTPANLTSLPAGWTGPSTFTCATLSSGNGCMLNLTYQPTAPGGSSFTLNYSYTNNAGTSQTRSTTVSFAATTNDNVVATNSPAGQIVGVTNGTSNVGITFTTDDGQTATNLAITPANLISLPAGWTGPSTFTCPTLSSGNGCMLNLTYQPTAVVGSSTLNLSYAYTNNAGIGSTGMASVNYVAIADNTVTGTPSPSTVAAVVGQASQTVTVTFNSNDGNPASNLVVTPASLTLVPTGSLPAGWSGPSSFTCSSVSTGNSCQLSLTYTPTTAAAGSVQLNYGYNSNSGTARTASVTIPYTATTNNNLVATQSPTGSISAVVNSGSVPVTLTFTTDDGNPATTINITSGLGTLPAGWSGPATFTCASASTGTGCQLALTYAPTVNGSSSIALGYSYTDDAGTAKTGTANIAYASIPGFVYMTDRSSNVVSCAISGLDGSLSACANAATGLNAPTGIAFSGNFAYVTPGIVATDVDVCPVNADGTLGTCISAATFTLPSALAVSGGYLYVTDQSGANVFSCPINSTNGSLGTCTSAAVGTVDTMDGIAVTATTAYIVDINDGYLTTCTVSSVNGTLSACTQATLNDTAPGGGNSPNASPRSASIYGGNLYVGTAAGDMILPIAGNGTVTPLYSPTFCSLTPGTSCTIDGDGTDFTTIPHQTPITGFAFNNGYAYVAGFGGGSGIGICTIESSGVLDNCVTSSNSFLNLVYGGIAVH